jgi:hypothetical protein
MALTDEFIASIGEAAESAITEAESDVANLTDQEDAEDSGGDEGDGGTSDQGDDSEEDENSGNSNQGESEVDGEEDEPGQHSDDSDGATEDATGQAAEDQQSDPAPRLNSFIERAVRAGISLEDAQAFPSDRALENACVVLESAQQHDVNDNDETPDPLDAIENLDPEEYGPEAIELLGGLTAQIREQREQIKALMEDQKNSATHSKEAYARDVEQQFNEQVAKLGEDFAEVLGAGAYSSLAPGSPQLAKRDAIAEQMTVTAAGLQAMGRPVPPLEELFDQAAGVVLREEFSAVKERKLQESLRNRSKQHLSRAGKRGSKTSNETPVEATVAALKRKFFSGS